MPLGKEVGLGPGHIVLDGDPVGTQRPRAAPPHFSAHVYCGQTVAHLSNCWALVLSERQRPGALCVQHSPTAASRLIQHLSENVIFVFPRFARSCRSTSYL